MSRILIVISMLIVGAGYLAAEAKAACYSDGVRVGTVQKFSKKGMLVKSWEGELVMEGDKLRGNAHQIRGGNVWRFSVVDAEVAKVIDQAVMTGSQVALRYCQVMIQIGQTDTDYHITQAVERK